MSGDDDQPPQEERQRRRSRSRERVHPHAQVPQGSQTQHMVIPEPDDVSDKDFSEMNPSSPSAEPPTISWTERSLKKRREIEIAWANTSTVIFAGRRWKFSNLGSTKIAWATAQGHHKNEKAHEDRIHKNKRERRLLQKNNRVICQVPKRTSPLFQMRTMKNLKTSLELLQIINLLYQYFLITLVMKTVSIAMNIVHKVGTPKRTLFYPDLYVLTNDEHWTMTPETHKYAAAAGSCCVSMTENGEQQDICNLITMPCVQRSLCLNGATNDFNSIKVEVPKGVDGQTRDMLERCMATCGRVAGTRAKMRSRARKEASAQEVRGYWEQFAEAKHLEYRSWVDNEVCDLIEMRKVKPNYVTGRWVLTIKTDKQGNFLRAKAWWVLRGFQCKQKEYLQTDSPASTRPRFRMSCQMAASGGWNLFHFHLKTASLQGQSCDVSRDDVCCKTEETCIRREWCPQTLVECPWEGPV